LVFFIPKRCRIVTDFKPKGLKTQSLKIENLKTLVFSQLSVLAAQDRGWAAAVSPLTSQFSRGRIADWAIGEPLSRLLSISHRQQQQQRRHKTSDQSESERERERERE
jgi:hypothetical protein